MSETPDSYFWSKAVPPLLQWYRANRRELPWRKNPTPYETWISEVMLQQTRVEAVKEYYIRFLKAFPNVEALANAPEEQLMKLWEGLGYYSRARNLKKAAKQIIERHGDIPADYEALCKLAGIGPYTAGAIASIAFSIPVAAVDGNVLRVYSRLQEDHGDIALEDTKKRVTSILNAALSTLPPQDVGDFNQALMELGATVCVPNGPPRCKDCSWCTMCLANAHGTAFTLPIKSAKKARRVENWAVLILSTEGTIGLEKRKKTGLLAGLWGLPMLSGNPTISMLTQTVRDYGLEPLQIQTVGRAKHVFTHVEWHMQAYHIVLETANTAFVWVDPYEIPQAVPSAFRYFLPAVTSE